MPTQNCDQAFRANDPNRRWPEMTCGGALNFMRRKYTGEWQGVEVVGCL